MFQLINSYHIYSQLIEVVTKYYITLTQLVLNTFSYTMLIDLQFHLLSLVQFMGQ